MKIIIVSNRGPFNVEADSDGKLNLKQNIGGLATSLHSYLSKETVFNSRETIWIHTSETRLGDSNIRYLEERFRIKPIFIEPSIYQSFYNACCNQQIYPSLLNIIDFYVEDACSFEQYESVNYQLRDAIFEVYEPGDIIWIHDYHFLLLPKLLRQLLPTAYITFFLHTPFPIKELFAKKLPSVFIQTFSDSILHANKVGFQTVEYKNNFIDCILNNLGAITVTESGVYYNGNTVEIISHPISVDFEYYNRIAAEKQVVLNCKKAKAKFLKKKIMLSIDRLDPCKGLLNKLEAFELFLTQNPKWVNQISFVFIVAPSREETSYSKKLLEDIKSKVYQINSKFSKKESIIKFHYRRHTLAELIDYYCISDILLITSLYDGVNLICKEYIACRLNHDGVVILSERAGASVELQDTLLINPYDNADIAEKIKQGMCMPINTQEEKMHKLRNFLRSNDIDKWGSMLLGEYFRRRNQL